MGLEPTVTQEEVNITVPSETTGNTVVAAEFVLNRNSRLQATLKEQVILPVGTTVQVWFNGFRNNDRQPVAELKVMYPNQIMGRDRSTKITGLWERFLKRNQD